MPITIFQWMPTFLNHSANFSERRLTTWGQHQKGLIRLLTQSIHCIATNFLLDFPLTEFPSATIDDVEDIIRRSWSKSCDLDPLPTALLKLCLPELRATLLSIINHSLDTGVVPSHFKKARVTPVPKSRATSSDNVSNYQPISQLLFISKVLERVVTNRIRPHLEENHQIGRASCRERV